MFASVRQTFRTLTGPHGVWPAVSHFKKANIRMGVCAEGLQDQKKALRKEMKARLRHMSAEDTQAESMTLLDPAHAGSLTAQIQACTHSENQPSARCAMAGMCLFALMATSTFLQVMPYVDTS